MPEFVVPDCLVLKLEENEEDRNIIDTTVYLFYDKKEHNYVIRGQRRNTDKVNSCTYSFICEDISSVADFIQYIICPSNLVTEILYNFDNFPINSDEITFDFLKSYDAAAYEIAGYNNQELTRKNLLRKLKMLRNVFNYYK